MAREMKDSGVEWIGQIPKEWGIGKVKKCFVRKNEKAKQENPIVLSLARTGVKIRDISTGEGQIAESYFNYNPVEIGDLLLNPMDLYSGANCSISKVKGVISPAYINLKAINGNNSIFYDYYFKTQYWGMVLFAHGKGVSFDNRWTLNTETLFNYFLPIPSKEEQEKISSYLDKKVVDIDLIIEKTKTTIEDYKKYKQSIITEAVTKGLNPDVEMKDSGIEWIGKIPKYWEVTKVKHYVKIENGKDPKTEGDIPVYGSGAESFKTCGEYKIGPTVLLGRKGATLHIPHYIDGKYWNVDTAFNIIPNNKIFLRYFYFLACCFDYKYYISQTTLPGMTQTNYGNIYIPFPEKEEQQQIADYLDKKVAEIDNLIAKKESLINEMEEYKKSLIYECVTGKKEIV